MPAKPVVVFGLLGLLGLSVTTGSRPAHAKPPLPTVLLFPASSNDVPTLVDLRTRLRLDGHLQVLSYDAESASIKRVASETSHPEWLLPGLLTDEAKLALARALGMAFYVVVSPGREANGTHLQLVDTVPPALTFDWYGVNHQSGARAIESQAEAALASHPVTAAPEPPAPVMTAQTPAPIAIAPTPAPAPEPPVVLPTAPAPTPEPSPSVASPVVVPPVVAPPVVAPPVIAAPTPQIQEPLPSPIETPTPLATAPVAVPAPALMPAPSGVSPSAASPPFPAPIAPPVPTLLVQVPPPPPVVAPETPPAAVPPAAPPMMAMLPGPAIPSEPVAPIQTPVPLPAPSPAAPVRPLVKVDDLTAITGLMNRGDSALEGGDVVGAISLFRQAVNNAPLSVVPRLKLAQAYQRGGLTDKALDEARRAMEIAPDSLPVQQFLTQLDQENGTSDGSLTRYRTLVQRNPTDPTAHSGLAETLWNSGDLAGAEAEYLIAKKLALAGDHSASAHLAQLYATQARYDDCLTALQDAGKDGYALAIRIVRNRSDALSSTVESSRDAFGAGRSTREQFYKNAQNVSAQAGALAGFVAKITPPADYKLSHLHRMLSTNLLAQEAATLVSFIETGEAGLSDSVAMLDKEAQTEMLTAQAAEEKLGLWEAKK